MHSKGQTVVFGKCGDSLRMMAKRDNAKISACAIQTIFRLRPSEKMAFRAFWKAVFLGGINDDPIWPSTRLILSLA